MTKPTIRLPDVTHPDEPYPWGVHRAVYSDMCPLCKARTERRRRIDAFHRSFLEFGYSTLTREETAEAYDIAMTRDVTAAALNELGVPSGDYPAPVANAVAVLRAALSQDHEGAGE